MVYIQRKGKPVTTVAEFKTREEAYSMLQEYKKAFPYDNYYLSSRPCKAWNN